MSTLLGTEFKYMFIERFTPFEGEIILEKWKYFIKEKYNITQKIHCSLTFFSIEIKGIFQWSFAQIILKVKPYLIHTPFQEEVIVARNKNMSLLRLRNLALLENWEESANKKKDSINSWPIKFITDYIKQIFT